MTSVRLHLDLTNGNSRDVVDESEGLCGTTGADEMVLDSKGNRSVNGASAKDSVAFAVVDSSSPLAPLPATVLGDDRLRDAGGGSSGSVASESSTSTSDTVSIAVCTPAAFPSLVNNCEIRHGKVKE